MDETFISSRITELRLQRNISEYQMSMELGQSKGYIQAITSGRSMPSMKQLFNIIDYFDMTPSEFFNPADHDSPMLHRTIQILRSLHPDDIQLILELAARIQVSNSPGGNEPGNAQADTPMSLDR